MDASQPQDAALTAYACPQCRKPYRIRNAQPDKKYLCKDCRAVLRYAGEAGSSPATVLAPPAVLPGVSTVGAPEDDLELKLEGEVSAPKPPADLTRLLPQIFGGYRVIKELGRGGMGAVLLAEHLDLRRKTALKIMLPGAGTPNATERFMREARLMAKFKHPNLVEIHGVGTVNEMPYLSMEFIEGRPLSEFLEQRKLGFRQAAELLAKAARALACAHERGVIHRDLKPDNIMVRHNGEPVVMDFGLAREDRNESVKLSMTGSVMGTPSYMSPEQAQGLMVDARSDVYSLGAVLYEALAHRPPFEGKTMIATIYQVVNEPARPIHELDPDVPQALERICAKAMHKDTAQRYQQMHAFAEDLKAFLEGRAISAAGPTLGQRATAWWRAHRSLGVGAGVAGAVLLLLALAFLSGWIKPARSRADELRAALRDGSPQARLLHLKALAADLKDGRIKRDSAEATAALEVLREAVGDAEADGGVAVAAMEALGDLRDEGALPALKRQLMPERPVAVRKAALAAYAHIHPVDTGAVCFQVLKDDPEVSMRIAAIEALGTAPDPVITLHLVRLATRGEPAVLAAAARAKLKQVRDPGSVLASYAGGRTAGAVQAVGQVLGQAADYNQQLEDAMGELDGNAKSKDRKPEPFEVASEKLLRGKSEERLQAAFDLGVLADTRSEPRLVAALLDADGDVALAAADALGRLAAVKDLKAIEGALKSPGPQSRRAAARALGALKPVPDGTTLTEALNLEKDPAAQAEMAHALGRLRSPKAGAPLLVTLAEGSPAAKRKAAWALGQLGSPHACAALLDALERAGEDKELRAEAAGALAILTGKSLGEDAAKWREALKKSQ